jgi:hypothetical protein
MHGTSGDLTDPSNPLPNAVMTKSRNGIRTTSTSRTGTWPSSKGGVHVHVHVNELRSGFTNTTRHPTKPTKRLPHMPLRSPAVVIGPSAIVSFSLPSACLRLHPWQLLAGHQLPWAVHGRGPVQVFQAGESRCLPWAGTSGAHSCSQAPPSHAPCILYIEVLEMWGLYTA